MTRTERLLRLARLRGDRAAVAILEPRRGTQYCADRQCSRPASHTGAHHYPAWLATETELRALWGDR